MATHSNILAWRIPMNRGVWRATVHGVSKSRTRLSRELAEHNYFTILRWFLPYISMNWPCVHMSPPFWYPLPPLFHPVHLGFHRALALGSLRQISDSHWLSVLHMEMYMFQGYSLKSSHPPLPLLCPKVCSLCLCLLRCLAHRIIGTNFLDSVCMH